MLIFKQTLTIKASRTISRLALLLVIVLLACASIYTFHYFTNTKQKNTSKTEQTLHELDSLGAYNFYFQGRNKWNKQDERSIRAAIIFFDKAIRLDTNLAQAWSGLADCYSALGYGSYEPPDSVFPKAEAAALRALQLDSSLADAYTSLGYVRFYYHRDWPAAEHAFTKAVQSDPHYEIAFNAYTYYLTAMERFPEAGVTIEKALQINPLSARTHVDKGFFLYYSGHYPEAVQVLQAAIAANPKSPLAHLWLARAYEEMNQYDKSIKEFQLVLTVNHDWPVAQAGLGWVYGVSGQREKANAVLDTLMALSHERFVTPYGIALVYSSLDQQDKAFEWLEKAYTGNSNWLVWLKQDPRWRNIRKDPRYGKLLQQVGLVREKAL